MTTSGRGRQETVDVTHPRALSALLVLSAFLASADILVIEILAGRILAPYVGMSVYTWTAIISTILAGLTIGNYIGGRLSTGDTQTDCRRLGWIFAAAAFATIAILFLARPLAGAVLATTESAVAAVLLLSGGIFLLPALFGGMTGPVIARAVLALNPDNHGHTLGFVYAAGSAGAIVGSILSGFVLIPWLGSAQSTLIAGGVLVVLAILWLSLGRMRAMAAVAGVLLIAATWGAGAGWREACLRESALFCIRVIPMDAPDLARAGVRGLVLDHLVHGMNVRDEPGALISPYASQMHRAVLRLHPEPESVFFVGGGAYTIPRAWGQALAVTVAEIDPVVTEVAREHLWLDPTGMTILHEDARVALRRLPDRSFDLVVGDAFKDVAAPFHLLTAEFNALVHRKMKPGGLYLLNLVDREPETRALKAVAATFATAFRTVIVWKELNETGKPKRHTFVVVGTDRTIDPAMLRAATQPGWATWRIASEDRSDAMVLTDAHAPLEHLLGLAADTIN